MMKRILLSSRADADIAEIWEYLSHVNRQAADRLILRIDEMIRHVAANPELGIRCDEVREGLYCKPVQRNYVVYYEVRGNVLLVVRVLHSARQQSDLL